MEQTNWAPEHSGALRESIASGMSFSQIAQAINAKFNTAYTRNAVIGRAKRMGLAGLNQVSSPMMSRAERSREAGPDQPRLLAFSWPMPPLENAEPIKLRCVEIEPRHLALIELERSDCRYPYGGDVEGEAITFCGHPRQAGTSYCTPHFRLSRDPAVPLEVAESAVWLRAVEAV